MNLRFLVFYREACSGTIEYTALYRGSGPLQVAESPWAGPHDRYYALIPTVAKLADGTECPQMQGHYHCKGYVLRTQDKALPRLLADYRAYASTPEGMGVSLVVTDHRSVVVHAEGPEIPPCPALYQLHGNPDTGALPIASAVHYRWDRTRVDPDYPRRNGPSGQPMHMTLALDMAMRPLRLEGKWKGDRASLEAAAASAGAAGILLLDHCGEPHSGEIQALPPRKPKAWAELDSPETVRHNRGVHDRVADLNGVPRARHPQEGLMAQA